MSSQAMVEDARKTHDGDDYILEVNNLKKHFPISSGIVFQRQLGRCARWTASASM